MNTSITKPDKVCPTCGKCPTCGHVHEMITFNPGYVPPGYPYYSPSVYNPYLNPCYPPYTVC